MYRANVCKETYNTHTWTN